MDPIILDLETVAIDDVDTYLEPVSAPSNYKDAEKIAAYQRDERRRQAERAALDVDLARIIVLAVKLPDYSTQVLTVKDRTEGDILAWLWERWHSYGNPRLVTFNGLGYDVPLLLRRSLYLGVSAPYISCDRYRHPEQIDLMAILSMDGKLKAHGLQFYLNRFGYPKAGPDISGADVAECYAKGEWAAIEAHARADVDGTAWLAERIGAVPKRQPIGEAVGF